MSPRELRALADGILRAHGATLRSIGAYPSQRSARARTIVVRELRARGLVCADIAALLGLNVRLVQRAANRDPEPARRVVKRDYARRVALRKVVADMRAANRARVAAARARAA